MGRKKKRSAGGRPRRSAPAAGTELFMLLGLVVIMFYLWGRVQINTALREKHRLEKMKAELEREVSDLQVQNDRLKSYTHIRNEVTQLGMREVPQPRISKLYVDMEGLNRKDTEETGSRLNLAGLSDRIEHIIDAI